MNAPTVNLTPFHGRHESQPFDGKSMVDVRT